MREGGHDARGAASPTAFRLAARARPAARRSSTVLRRRLPDSMLADFRARPRRGRRAAPRRRVARRPDARPRRAGRLRRGRQRDPEPRRDDHQGVSRMDPLREHRLALTRRHFFGRTGGRASARRRWRRCWAAIAPAPRTSRATPSAACRGCRTSPPKAKRVIYLFHVGRRRRRSTCSTTSRSSSELHGKELPDSVRDGPAAHRR